MTTRLEKAPQSIDTVFLSFDHLYSFSREGKRKDFLGSMGYKSRVAFRKEFNCREGPIVPNSIREFSLDRRRTADKRARVKRILFDFIAFETATILVNISIISAISIKQ